jgi:hypothetical protein
LLANTLFGIWWLDPVVALGIAALAITEGRRAWRGESCGCATCASDRHVVSCSGFALLTA